MPVTDAALAQLTYDAYEYDGKPFPWTWQTTAAGVQAGIVRTFAGDVIIFPGSRTLQDWQRDFFALPAASASSPMGSVHAGFYAGLPQFMQALQASGYKLTDEFFVTGHSLGAARAPLFAGLLKMQGRTPTRVTCFAPPRPGMSTLAEFLAPLDVRLYRNADDHGHDYVTDVPVTLPPWFAFQHVRPLIDITAPPKSHDGWGLFSYHHMELYLQGVQAAGV